MKRNTTKEIILNKHENNAVEYKFTRNHANVAENNMTLVKNSLRGGSMEFDSYTRCLGQVIVESYLKRLGLKSLQRKYGQEIGFIRLENGKSVFVCTKGTCVPYCHSYYDCDVKCGSHASKPDYYCFVRIQGKVVGSSEGGYKKFDHKGYNKAFICGFIPFKKMVLKKRQVKDSKGCSMYRCYVSDLTSLQ